jgi:hypothetical protein
LPPKKASPAKKKKKSLHLPNPSTIRSWASSIDCEPGFLNNVIEHLQNTLEDDDKDCVILIDAKNKKFAGNTDYGPILAEGQDTIAHNALVVMAVGLQKPWSYPIAYFLTNHMDAPMQAQIIKESINLLTDAGLDVHAVTFDGCSKNLATARCLGCKLDKFDGSFKHPTRPDRTLYVILDICHMLKLASNALGDKEIFLTDGKETISWHYIKELFNVQQSDILHLRNKLKNVHIKWHNQKMKVAVAAQTLSSSVAAGMMYLRSLKIKQFENCEHTAEFIQNNDIFDILNTKSKFGKRYKRPLTLEKCKELQQTLPHIISYLKKLKDVDETKLVDGRRKTFILGFAVSANSILAMAKKLLSREHNKFEYVLTYRFSQDQVEMYFSKIRSRLGWNNNLNALQFKWALRALLQKNQITAFECLKQHSRESHVLDEQFCEDHITIIINKLIDLYVKRFSHRFRKVYTDRVVREGKSSKRPKLTKLILFGND